jgi:hypothetical protein
VESVLQDVLGDNLLIKGKKVSNVLINKSFLISSCFVCEMLINQSPKNSSPFVISSSCKFLVIHVVALFPLPGQ